MPTTTCDDAPAPPAAGADDRAIVAYFNADHLAGANCRAHLKAVHDAQSKWPTQPATQEK